MTAPTTVAEHLEDFVNALRTMRCPTCGAVLTEYASPKPGEKPAELRTFFCGSHGEDPFVVSVLAGVLEGLAEGDA